MTDTTRRLCCCGCGHPAKHILVRHGTTRIDLGFSARCRDKFEAAVATFRRRCPMCLTDDPPTDHMETTA